MGLTKRKDGYYVEFPVLDDGKVLSLAPKGMPAKIKRWKAGVRMDMAKNLESTIRVDLRMGRINSKKTQNKTKTFAQWGKEYLNLPEVKALKSYRDRVGAVTQRLIPFFGSQLLPEITKSNITIYRTERRKPDGTIPCIQTINYDHAILKHVFSRAQDHGYIEQNPAKEVPIPDPKNERDRILSDDEWKRLYESSPPHLKSIILTAYYTGMRFGEVINLTWDRVDLKKGLIQLRNQDTKNGEAREVPMISVVKQHLEGLWKDRVLHTNRVFLYENRPFKGVKSSFTTALKKAEIEDFQFRDSRHCGVTNWRRAGVDLTTAMAIVGHKSEKMWKRYNTIETDDLIRAGHKLNTLITLGQFPHQTSSVQPT